MCCHERIDVTHFGQGDQPPKILNWRALIDHIEDTFARLIERGCPVETIARAPRGDEPKALEQRILEVRRSAFTRILSDAEWRELDRMRDVTRAHEKFEQAVREARQ
jgi:hypothetical protein